MVGDVFSPWKSGSKFFVVDEPSSCNLVLSYDGSLDVGGSLSISLVASSIIFFISSTLLSVALALELMAFLGSSKSNMYSSSRLNIGAVN